MQEQQVLIGRRYRSASGNFANVPRSGVCGSHNSAIGAPKTTISVQKISQAQMEDRRKKRLCYNCDAKWQYGRKCQNKILNRFS